MTATGNDIDVWRQAHQRLTLAIAQSQENISAELAKRRFLLEEIAGYKAQTIADKKKKVPQKKSTSGAKARKAAVAVSIKSKNTISFKERVGKSKKRTKSSDAGDKVLQFTDSPPADVKRKIKIKVKKPLPKKLKNSDQSFRAIEGDSKSPKIDKSQFGKIMATLESSSDDDEDEDEDAEMKTFSNLLVKEVLDNKKSSSEESDDPSDDDHESDEDAGDSDVDSESSTRDCTGSTSPIKHDSTSRSSDALTQKMGYHPHQSNLMPFQTAYGVMPRDNIYPSGYGMMQNMGYGMSQMQHYSPSRDQQSDSDEIESDDDE